MWARLALAGEKTTYHRPAGASFSDNDRDKGYTHAFTAKKLGSLSTLQRPLPTVDKTPSGLA